MSSWIKVEKNTPNKPEMRRIAQVCNCSREKAFYCWFKLWQYFDHETEDGFIPYLSGSDIDEIAGLDAMSDALEDVNWIVLDSTGVTIINWDRHNGESAKRRCLQNERQRRKRKKDATS